jgi:transcriptional regulator with XRE-family HTH domain
MDNERFARTLEELIESRGISQKRLSVDAGTTEATISRYIAGKNQPEIKIVVRIAKALNVSVDYLCGLTDSPTPRENLGAEIQLLMRCYVRSDARDKKTLWTVLERYMTPEEKDGPCGYAFTEGRGTRAG